MTSDIQQWNLTQLGETRGYSHVSESVQDGVVYLSGFATTNMSGEEDESKDLEHQTRKVIRDIFAVLEEAGLGPEHIIRRTTYVVNLTQEKASIILSVYEELIAPHSKPAASMIGVTALAHPNMLIEIECTAIRPSMG